MQRQTEADSKNHIKAGEFMKKFFKVLTVFICSFLALTAVVFVGAGVLGPVSLDAGACTGGFEANIIREYRDDIEKAAGETITEEEFKTLNIGWGGRNLGAHFVNDDGEEISVKGTRVWYGVYKWKKV